MVQPNATPTAYVVPKLLWDRVYTEWKKMKETQTGGTVVGTTSQGVDPVALLHALAVNASLKQSPKMEFVKFADQAIKKILDDPNMNHEDKIQALETYTTAYRSQRGEAKPVVPAATSTPPPVAIPPAEGVVTPPTGSANRVVATPESATFPTLPPPTGSGARPKPKTPSRRQLPETPTTPKTTPLKGSPPRRRMDYGRQLQTEIDILNNLRNPTPEQRQVKKQLLTRQRNMFRAHKPLKRFSPS